MNKIELVERLLLLMPEARNLDRSEMCTYSVESTILNLIKRIERLEILFNPIEAEYYLNRIERLLENNPYANLELLHSLGNHLIRASSLVVNEGENLENQVQQLSSIFCFVDFHRNPLLEQYPLETMIGIALLIKESLGYFYNDGILL